MAKKTAAKTRRKRVAPTIELGTDGLELIGEGLRQRGKRRRPAPDNFTVEPARRDGSPEGFNQSQITDYARCAFRWHLRNRRKIDRREIAAPMDLGSAVHAGIAGAIHTFAGFDKPNLRPAQRTIIDQSIVAGIRTWRNEWMQEHAPSGQISDEIDDQLTDLQYKALDIATRSVQELDLSRWEVVKLNGIPLVEQKITISITLGGKTYQFYITPDVVWKDLEKPGGTWVTDFKVREKLQAVEHEEVDLQLPAYQYVLGQVGILTTGSIKFQIRAMQPQLPQLNKNKSMSRQRIATTWEVYRSELVKHGLNPKEYEVEMRQKLDVEFFRMDRIFRNQFEVNAFWQDIIIPTCHDMLEDKRFVRRMHFMNCTGCWARELCLAELRGEDTDFLLQTTYVDMNSPKAKLVLRPEDVQLVVDDD